MHMLAAAAEHPLLDIDMTLFIQLGLFLLLLIVLSKLLFKPFLEVHEQRQQATVGARAEADEMSGKAGHDAAIYEDRLGKARAKALEERSLLRQDATRHEREILLSGRKLADEHLAATKRQIQTSFETARAELAPRVTELSENMAKKILGREVRS